MLVVVHGVGSTEPLSACLGQSDGGSLPHLGMARPVLGAGRCAVRAAGGSVHSRVPSCHGACLPSWRLWGWEPGEGTGEDIPG